MRNFWSKFNELVFSPIAILVFAAGYYGVYHFFGPEAGLVPPGYFTNILAGAAVMYIAGWMATLAIRLNFPHYYRWVFDRERAASGSDDQHEFKNRALCVYFAFYALSIWALTSML